MMSALVMVSRSFTGLVVVVLFLSSVLLGVAQDKPAAKDRTKSFGDSLKPKKQDKSSQPGTIGDPIDTDSIKVRTELVFTDVLVANQRGDIILGLKKEDFVVTENGVLQSIEHFAIDVGAKPRDIALVFDYSGSILGFLKESVAAAKSFVADLRPGDRVALVTDDVELLVDFTDDKKKLNKKLDEIADRRRMGHSRQISALAAVLQELLKDAETPPLVIFQTDADEFWLLKDQRERLAAIRQISFDPCADRPCPNFTFDQLLNVVRRSRATIYPIVPGFNLIGVSSAEQRDKMIRFHTRSAAALSERFGLPKRKAELPEARITESISSMLHQQKALVEIARVSGGHMDFIETPEDSAKVYKTLLTTIQHRYQIGYSRSSDQTGWRNVAITIRDHPEFKILTRKDFFIR